MKILSSELYVKDNKVYHEGNKPKPKDIGAAPTVHNHTSLTGITNLSFVAEGTDSASITTTVDGTNTYFDFNLSDDPSHNDMWRWRFHPSGGNLFNAMTLDAISTTEAKLAVTGEVQATRLKGTLTGNVTGTVSGNAGSATKLATARTINGTSFDGTANITTANWGTARNIQIGNAVKSVNGSANVTWSLSEIGAAPSSSTSLKTTDKTIVGAINEVFQSADSARSSLVSAIGSPLTSTDTLASIATKLQSKKQELGTAASKVVNGVSSSTNLNTIVSTLNGYKPYVGRAHTLYVDFNGGKTVYIEPQKANGSTTMKQGSTWMAMIKDIHAKRDYCVCSNTSYGFPSQTKDANNAVSFEIDGGGTLILYSSLYTSKTYKIMLCSINPTYSEIDETESSSYYYVVKTLEEKDEEEGRKDEESNC